MHQVIHEFSLQYLPQKKKKIVCNIKKKKKKINRNREFID